MVPLISTLITAPLYGFKWFTVSHFESFFKMSSVLSFSCSVSCIAPNCVHWACYTKYNYKVFFFCGKNVFLLHRAPKLNPLLHWMETSIFSYFSQFRIDKMVNASRAIQWLRRPGRHYYCVCAHVVKVRKYLLNQQLMLASEENRKHRDICIHYMYIYRI